MVYEIKAEISQRSTLGSVVPLPQIFRFINLQLLNFALYLGTEIIFRYKLGTWTFKRWNSESESVAYLDLYVVVKKKRSFIQRRVYQSD